MGGDPRGRHRLSRAGGRSGSSRSAPAAAANLARTARRSSSRWTRSPQASRASCSSSCRCRARAGPRRYGPRSHRKKASNGVASRSVAAFERWLVRASSGGSGRQDPRHSARWSVRWHLSSASKATVPSSGGPTAGDSTPGARGGAPAGGGLLWMDAPCRADRLGPAGGDRRQPRRGGCSGAQDAAATCLLRRVQGLVGHAV